MTKGKGRGLKLTNNKSVNFNAIIPSRVCDRCGKEILLPTGGNFTDYVYKTIKGRRRAYFCSWGCLRAEQREGVAML